MSQLKHLLVLLNIVVGLVTCNGGVTSPYVRKSTRTVDIPLKMFTSPPGFNAPEQVHITQGDHDGKGVIITWVTLYDRQPNLVTYWEANTTTKQMVQAKITNYKYYTYESGFIHHATIHGLKYDTLYNYELGSEDTVRQFHFRTPPQVGPDAAYTFGVIGDLGQTYASNQTFEHYCSNPEGQAMLMIGDLAYADDHLYHDNNRWDSFGRFIEKSAAYQAWITAPGNHELDYAPEIGEIKPWKPYTHRYHVPFKASKSVSPLWYSIKRASAYIIVLSSYSAYGKYTPQYNWLEKELPKVNRSETPWLLVLVHSPWYNSNNYHYMEGESMRVMFEKWFIDHKVDVVFSGHVHSYERSHRFSNVRYNISNGLSIPVKDLSAPVYINIGDGGNIEGLANNFTIPQPDYSAFREASYGHGVFSIKNRTHAHWTWHRNQESERVAADCAWLHNRHYLPDEEH